MWFELVFSFGVVIRGDVISWSYLVDVKSYVSIDDVGCWCMESGLKEGGVDE
jgi:hypothetical protein